MNLQFEWDENKRHKNLEKHGIDFVLAARALLDVNRIERVDDRKEYGETRYQCIGHAGGMLLLVVYTHRETMIRMISARRANHEEREAYLHLA